MTSEFAKLIDDEMLKEDCQKLKDFNHMKDSKIFKVLSEELQRIVEDEQHDIETTYAIYKYYGRVLNRLKGD
ncbi:MAG TPA: hypothetical protein PK924_06860 [Bacilli bacterium]|nr:hypothetical protein [Bacilli bacterium]